MSGLARTLSPLPSPLAGPCMGSHGLPARSKATSTALPPPLCRMAGQLDDLRHWVLANKLKAVFGFWATGLSVSMAYQWTRPIPTQLKIIHSRMYAQARAAAASTGAAARRRLSPQHPLAGTATSHCSLRHLQALTLAGLGIAGAVQWLEDRSDTAPAPKATGFDR